MCFFKLFLGLLFFVSINVYSLEYYWVGGTGNWNDFAVHWATTSGGSTFHSAVPSLNDNVIFDVNSFTAPGQSVTINVSASCLNMTWTATTNTPSLAGSSSLTIYGSLTLISAMNITATGTVNFSATSSGKTVTSAGKQFKGLVSFNGVGGAWTLNDAINTTGELQFTNGSLTTNNNTVSCKYLYCNSSNARTLNLGSSTINIIVTSYQTGIDLRGSNFTLNSGTSSIIFSFSSDYYVNNYLNGKTLYNVTYPAGNFEIRNSGSCSYNNLTIGAGNSFLVEAASNQTVSGTFSADGNCSNYITIISRTPATAATFTFPNGAQSIDNIMVQDIISSTNTLNCDECVNIINNSGTWNFTNNRTTRSLYWIAGNGNYSDPTKWSSTSGGANDITCSPTPVDNVFFDINSFSGASQEVEMDKKFLWCNNMNWTGATNNPTFDDAVINSVLIFGELNFIPSMSVNGGNATWIFRNSGATKINSQGFTLGGSTNDVNILGGGIFTLESNMSIGGSMNIYSATTLDVLPSVGSAGVNEKNLLVGGSWNNSGTFNEGSCTTAWVILNGAGSISNNETFYNLETNTASGTGHYVFGSNITVTNIYKGTLGKFEYSTSAKNFTANQFILNGGTFNLGSTSIFSCPTNLDLNGGTFDQDGGTATFTGDIDIDGGKLQIDGGTFNMNGNIADIATGTGEIEVNSGTLNIGNNTDEDINISGGILDVNAGTINVKNQVSMSSGKFEMGGGVLNIGTSINSDAIDRLVFSGGTYDLTGGKIDIKSTGGSAAGDYAIDIQATVTVGTITDGGSSNYILISASNFDSRISVFNTKKIASIEFNVTGARDVILDDHLECDGYIKLTTGELNPNGKNVKLSGDWLNNSSASAFLVSSESVTFDGTTTATQNIGGSYSTTFHDLIINNTATNGNVDIDIATTVNGTLTLTQGDIESKDFNIILTNDDTPGISGGSASSHINGVVVKTYANDTPLNFPLGDGTYYNPVELDPDGAASETWSLRYFRNAPPNFNTLCEASFNHVSNTYYWQINRSGTVNSKIKIFYNESNYVNESFVGVGELSIAHYNAGCSGGGWEFAPDNTNESDYTINTTDVGDIDGYVLTNNFVSSFSPFTLSTNKVFASQQLPLELLSFNAKLIDNDVILDWSTMSEINNDFFTIERSKDGNYFEPIRDIHGAGNSNIVLNYSEIDEQPLKGCSYYRLKQTDFDDKFTYSNIETIYFNDDVKEDLMFKLYPNPANEFINISTNANLKGRINIFDKISKLIYSEYRDFSANEISTIDLTRFYNGLYTIQFIVEGGNIFSKKLLIINN